MSAEGVGGETGGSGGRVVGVGSPASVVGVDGGRGESDGRGEGVASLATASNVQMGGDQPEASGSWGRGPRWIRQGPRG